MRVHVVQTADSGDRGALRDRARHGRAVATPRRRALAYDRSALAPSHERVRTGPPEAELRAPAAAGDATRPAAADGRATRSGAHGAPEATAVPINGVAAARLGRALSMQRRRQLSRGKQALNGGADRTTGDAGAGAPAFTVVRGGAR
jgi:hypothetical protein